MNKSGMPTGAQGAGATNYGGGFGTSTGFGKFGGGMGQMHEEEYEEDDGNDPPLEESNQRR